ncbi:restriction endonuclease subunit S [Lactiplantibacillus plantarum]|uniref:restriction endonuclease subunit S n=1 Tax=Lactiplantibacillus plantarum TaxID=1590 RepID=UPI001B3371E4|nr:restriction endonuclease subunit S [Lactiplantibacillus plantarum]MBP5835456.1 restriction endonuclease subunit S [Lactiplantibacillus plantarum]
MENKTLFGELPLGWKHVALSDITTFISRGRQPKYIASVEGIPVINQKMIRNFTIDYRYVKYNDAKKNINKSVFIKIGDTLVNSTGVGTVGRSAYISIDPMRPTFVDSHVTIVRPDTAIVDPKFMSVVLSSDVYSNYMGSTLAQGSTGQVELSRQKLSKMCIPFPPLNTQRLIGTIFDLIDQKIKLNHQINKNLLKLINNIYLREYFANPQVALADHVALSDLIQTKTKTFNPKKTSETLVNHFSMPAFDEDQYPIIDKVTSIKSNKNIVEPFSVLVSKMNPQVKRVWLPNISDKILNVASTEFLTFTADSAEMQAFIFAIVNNKSYKQFLMSNTTGSTNSRQRVLPRVAYSFEIAFNRIKAERLGELLVPFLEKIKLTKSEIQRLKKLRALLLPKLLSGSINLSSMEEAMKNA